jgi:tripartite-type tricarboxylate transporter receptor subunit TctC
LGDLRVRVVLAHLPRFIPGKPAVVNEYMPGAGGKKALNHLYRVAPPDGLTIGNFGSGVISAAVMKESGVQYDIDKLIYLGSGNSSVNNVFLTRAEVAPEGLAKLRSHRGLRIGAQSVGHDLYVLARIAAWLMDLPEPRFVVGFSGREVDFAITRGEVDASVDSVDAVIKQNSEWIEKRLVNFQTVFETPLGYRVQHPAFAKLPEFQSLSRSEWERKVLNVQRSLRLIGSPFILPPGVPNDRATVLRKAFNDMLKDPQFLSEWKKLAGEDPHPLSGEQQEKAIREMPREDEIVAFFNSIGGSGALPPRR